jgi:hypothetical protein
MRALVLYAVMLLAVPQAWADEPKPGDKAENMKVLPPWEMQLCTPDNTLRATYDKAGAIDLKKKDNFCDLWRTQMRELTDQVESYKRTEKGYQALIKSFDETRLADQEHIKTLTEQLMEEIEQKNKYKYKPSYGWLWGAAGGVVAAIAIGFGVGASVK